VTAIDVTATHAGAVRAPARAPRATDSDWLRELHHLPDALLHPRRRRAAHTQLQNARPRSVLFICHGNICRSPFAAAVFARLNPRIGSRRITAASAGFIGLGRTPPARALSAGLRRGLDISAHRSDVITQERLRSADLVVVMSAEQARTIRAHVGGVSSRVLVLGDLDPVPITRRAIADPWGGSDAAFDASYDRIDRCVRELVRIIQRADEP
jgi:low molecular weight protein-tyrosine phosphatase